jgi:maltoporin
MAIPFGIKFTGYARYGAHFQAADQKYVAVDGSYNGASAIGRLGNEGNGGNSSSPRPSRVKTAPSGTST